MVGTDKVLPPKRKRAVVSYAEPDDELIVSEDGIHDVDCEAYGPSRITNTPKTNTSKRARVSRPRDKRSTKPFPFLSLPPELRDYIYELALTEADGIALVSKTKAFRRTVGRGTIYKSSSYDDLENIQTETNSEPNQLSPNLLAVNKQIYAEGIGYLYKQPFILEDTKALHTFLAAIGGSNRAILSDLTIQGWGGGRGTHKTMNVASLTLLSTCTDMRKLHFDCTIGWQNTPIQLARRLYRDGHYFLEAFGSANGKRDAAVDIIKLHDLNYGKDDRYGWHGPVTGMLEPEEFKGQFQKELRRMLDQ